MSNEEIEGKIVSQEIEKGYSMGGFRSFEYEDSIPLYTGHNDFSGSLESYAKYLAAKRPGHGLGLLELVASMMNSSREEWRYGFDFFDVSSAERVKRMAAKFWEPRYEDPTGDHYKLRDFLREDLERLELCEAIFLEPECATALSGEEIDRMIGDIVDHSDLIIDFDCGELARHGIPVEKISAFRQNAPDSLRSMLKSMVSEPAKIAA